MATYEWVLHGNIWSNDLLIDFNSVNILHFMEFLMNSILIPNELIVIHAESLRECRTDVKKTIKHQDSTRVLLWCMMHIWQDFHSDEIFSIMRIPIAIHNELMVIHTETLRESRTDLIQIIEPQDSVVILNSRDSYLESIESREYETLSCRIDVCLV